MSKKILSVLFALSLVTLAGCGGGTEPAANTTTPAQTAAAAESPSAAVQTTEPVASEAATPSAEPTPTPEPTDAEPAAFSMDDMALEIDGTTYKIKDNAAAILEALGDDYEFSEAVSCVFDGMDKEYIYPAIQICTYPDGENDIIDQFLLTDDTYQTTRGIKVGSTKAEIEAVYGANYYMDGPYMTYNVSGVENDFESPQVYFELDDSEVVIVISLLFPTVEA